MYIDSAYLRHMIGDKNKFINITLNDNDYVTYRDNNVRMFDSIIGVEKSLRSSHSTNNTDRFYTSSPKLMDYV